MFSYIYKLIYNYFEWFSCKMKPEAIHSDYVYYYDNDKILQPNFMERI